MSSEKINTKSNQSNGSLSLLWAAQYFAKELIMYSCPTDKQLLASVRCEITEDEQANLETHLADCPNCRKRLSDMERRVPIFPSLSGFEDKFSSISRFDAQFDKFLETDEPLELPFLMGEYEVQESIGHGGMGDLYVAEHVLLKRKFAIKFIRRRRIIHPDAMRLFYQEIRAGGQLVHPNIVTATNAGVFNGMPYLVMELLEGETVQDYVQRCGKLSTPEACQIVVQAARGLQAVHEAGLIHCDVKPSNLWRQSNGQIKVMDLGLAQFKDETSIRHSGTPGFMAPEQIESDGIISEQIDVYSLGCTLFYLLTGQYYSSEAAAKDRKKYICTCLRNCQVLNASKMEKVLKRMVAELPRNRLKSMPEAMAQLEPETLRRSPGWLIFMGYFIAVLSLLIAPVPLMIVAIVIGILHKRKGSDFHGNLLIYVSILCGIIGTIIGTIIWTRTLDEASEESLPQSESTTYESIDENENKTVPVTTMGL